jgi:hypothetical protein
VITRDCGRRQGNPAGYCIGGLLLVLTLAWIAAGDDEEANHGFGAPTFMVSLQDYSEVGTPRRSGHPENNLMEPGKVGARVARSTADPSPTTSTPRAPRTTTSCTGNQQAGQLELDPPHPRRQRTNRPHDLPRRRPRALEAIRAPTGGARAGPAFGPPSVRPASTRATTRSGEPGSRVQSRSANLPPTSSWDLRDRWHRGLAWLNGSFLQARTEMGDKRRRAALAPDRRRYRTTAILAFSVLRTAAAATAVAESATGQQHDYDDDDDDREHGHLPKAQ